MPLELEQLKKIRNTLSNLKSWKQKLEELGDVPDIPLGSLPKFSDLVWFRKGEMVVVGARSSHGKSSFALQMAVDALKTGKTVALLSLEMTVENMMSRMFCHVMHVHNDNLFRCSPYTKEPVRINLERFEHYMNSINNRLYLTDHIGTTFDELNDYIVNVLEDVDLVIVDYIQSIKQDLGAEERQRLNEYIRQFRELSIRKGFCGVLVSQINRGAALHRCSRPTMAQLKGTGTLEEHADKVILLYYPQKDDDETTAPYEIIVEKNREGMTGPYHVRYIPSEYRFVEDQEFHAYYNPTDIEEKLDVKPEDIINYAKNLFDGEILDRGLDIKNLKKPDFGRGK